MATLTPSDLVLVLRHDVNRGSGTTYGHSILWVEQWDHASREPKTVYSYESPLAGLKIRTQYDSDGTARDYRSYAWEWGFDPQGHLVTYDELERHAKTLRTIHNRLERLNQSLGAAQTYGQWVARLMHATGIKRVAWFAGQDFQDRSGYRYQSTTGVSYVIDHIDSAIARFHEQFSAPKMLTA